MKTFQLDMAKAAGKDDLRPTMLNIYFHNGFMVATNAHILIKAKIKTFTHNIQHENLDDYEKQLSYLEDKFLSASNFTKIRKAIAIRVWENGIEDIYQGILYKFVPPPGKYPNYQAILDRMGEPQPIKRIGIDPKLLIKFCQILGDINYGMKIFFYGESKAIIIKLLDRNYTEDDFTGLIMPLMIND